MARPVRLTYINGIATHMEHMHMGEKEISKLFQEKVDFVWNPTAQQHLEDLTGWLGDLAQAGTQKLGRITNEVECLAEHLRTACRAVGPRGCVVHICHSQGALITSLACKLLTPDELTRIEILSFGGAVAIRKTSAMPFRRVMNYYSVNDPLLWVAPSAAQHLRSGRVVGAGEDDPEFCFLAPRLGDPIGDHDILGPTYSQALSWEGKRFQREHRSLGYKVLHPLYILFLDLQWRLREWIKSILRAILRLCEANYQWTNQQLRSMELWVDTWVWKPVVFTALVVIESIRSSWASLLIESSSQATVTTDKAANHSILGASESVSMQNISIQNQSVAVVEHEEDGEDTNTEEVPSMGQLAVVTSAMNHPPQLDSKESSFMERMIHAIFQKRQLHEVATTKESAIN